MWRLYQFFHATPPSPLYQEAMNHEHAFHLWFPIQADSTALRFGGKCGKLLWITACLFTWGTVKQNAKETPLNPFFLQFPHSNLSHTPQQFQTQVTGFTITKINRLWKIIVAVLGQTKGSHSLCRQQPKADTFPCFENRASIHAASLHALQASNHLLTATSRAGYGTYEFSNTQWISLPFISSMCFWTHMRFQHPQYHVAKDPTA